MERQIAGCRILLSAVALFAVAVDPTRPALLPQLTDAPLGIDAALATLAVHLVMSLGIYLGLVSGIVAPQAVATTTTWTESSSPPRSPPSPRGSAVPSSYCESIDNKK